MKTNINRRSFLKGAAMTGAAALAAGMAGCAPKTQSESLAETGGSEFGTFDADGVYTPSFLIAPDPVDESTLVETVEADVVVVGMGLAGICAARAALEEGASVICLEKGAEYHLHSHQITAINSKIAKEQGVEFSDEQLDRILRQVVADGRGRGNYNLLKHMVYHCGEDFDWYLEKCPSYTVLDAQQTAGETDLDYEAILNICTAGLAERAGRHFDDVTPEREEAARAAAPYINLFNHPVNPNWNVEDELYPMFASVIAVEPEHTYVGKYSAEFVEEGADVRYAVWARQLAKDDDGRVTGVYFEDEAGDMHKAVAKNGVILATGNFSSNPAMIDYYVRSAAELEPTGWPEVDAKGNVTNVGDGISLAAWAGAAIDRSETMTYVCDSYGGAMGCNPFLLVDGLGNRFMNEDVVGEVFGAKSMRVAGKVMWQIFDDDFPEQVSHMPVGHRCYWRITDNYDDIPMGHLFDPIGTMTRAEVEKMSQFKADSLEELAEQMGVPADAFAATIERYNELYDKGVDEDFGKRADRMAPVRKAPFYATAITPPKFPQHRGRCDERRARACVGRRQHARSRAVPGRLHGGQPFPWLLPQHQHGTESRRVHRLRPFGRPERRQGAVALRTFPCSLPFGPATLSLPGVAGLCALKLIESSPICPFCKVDASWRQKW